MIWDRRKRNIPVDCDRRHVNLMEPDPPSEKIERGARATMLLAVMVAMLTIGTAVALIDTNRQRSRLDSATRDNTRTLCDTKRIRHGNRPETATEWDLKRYYDKHVNCGGE